MTINELETYILENWQFVDETDKPMLKLFGVYK